MRKAWDGASISCAGLPAIQVDAGMDNRGSFYRLVPFPNLAEEWYFSFVHGMDYASLIGVSVNELMPL